jgi:hypothetical protein
VDDVNGPEFMIGYTITEIIRYRIIQMVIRETEMLLSITRLRCRQLMIGVIVRIVGISSRKYSHSNKMKPNT